MDRRALLRRELLKEQLANEAQAPVKDPSQMSIEEANAEDNRLQANEHGKELDAAIAGAAQGSTFGFSDELGGAKDAVLGVGEGSLAQRYRASQQARQAENKRLSEESPLSYMGGELVGGVASAAVTPSLGGAKLVSAAGELSPRVAAFLAARAPAGALTKMAGKGVAGLIEGAPIGAAYGLGSSENTIDKPAELTMDTVQGAKMGSLTGLGLSAAGSVGKSAIKKAGEFVDDSKFLRQLGKAYDYGKKGKNISSSRVQDELSTLPSEYSEQFVDKIMSADRDLGQAVGNAINKAQDAGVKINIDPELAASGQKIFKTIFVDNPLLGEVLDSKSSKLLQTIAQRDLGSLTPIEAKAFRDELYKLSDSLAGYNDTPATFAKSQANALAGKINETLKNQIPEYKLASSQFEQFRRLVPESIISKGTPSKYDKVFVGDLKNPELKLHESSEDMLKHAQLPGTGVDEQRKTMAVLGKNLKELEKTNPEAVKKLGGSSEDVIKSLRDKSDELAMIRNTMGEDPHLGLKKTLKGTIAGSGRSTASSIANKLGIVSKGVKQSAPVKLAGSVFSAGDDALRNVAQRLKSSDATASMGDALENSLNNKSDTAKKAVLFKLMQNPDFRNMLKEEGFDDGQQEQQ